MENTSTAVVKHAETNTDNTTRKGTAVKKGNFFIHSDLSVFMKVI